MVAIRVWAKCIKSKVNRNAAINARWVERNRRLPNTYMMGTMAIPNRLPMIRQPKGFMPKILMPMAMISLPRGGCVFSYGLILWICSYAVRGW
ncbi:hypothetical protein D3C75_1066320 [compost metagenome]